MESNIFQESILFATFKCINNTNQWTDHSFIFIFFIIFYLKPYGKCLINTNQLTDGTLWFAWFSISATFSATRLFRCILVAPWLTLGTLGPPSGSLLVPLGSLLVHFWYLLFLLLAPFGSLWLTFGTLFEEIDFFYKLNTFLWICTFG